MDDLRRQVEELLARVSELERENARLRTGTRRMIRHAFLFKNPLPKQRVSLKSRDAAGEFMTIAASCSSDLSQFFRLAQANLTPEAVIETGCDHRTDSLPAGVIYDIVLTSKMSAIAAAIFDGCDFLQLRSAWGFQRGARGRKVSGIQQKRGVT